MVVPLTIHGRAAHEGVAVDALSAGVGGNAPSVVLVGFQDQDNLGLRYLASTVRKSGGLARIVTYDSDAEKLIRLAREQRPDVIGFSLIFQYMAPDFARVIRKLRDAGVTTHITVGGHYSSFDPEEVLRGIDGLDSVVRYEGERTLVDLMLRLAAGEVWRGIKGITCRDDAGFSKNPLREAIEDLDELPWPDRDDIPYESQDLPTASLLGSRGCPWDCTFCSIRPFYEAQGGPLRRFRRPAEVAREMLTLHRERNVPVFLFQDDDFLAGGTKARQWACDIATELVKAEVAGRLTFKLSCRSDEIHEECIRQLIAGGLTHIYMGVESGDSDSLIAMSKRIRPEQHLRAGEVLKRLGVSFDFGFMLLDPQSTFQSVRNNIDFLESFVGDGWSVASFCRMLPYAGTPIKTQLEREGRLLGTPFEPDYRFLDPKLDLFYEWMLETFHERNFTSHGLCHVLKSLLFELNLRLDSHGQAADSDRAYARHLTAICNGLAFYTLRAAAGHIESTPLARLERDRSFLERLTRHEKQEEARLIGEVVDFYGKLRRRHGRRDVEEVGGFDRDWTLAEAGAG